MVASILFVGSPSGSCPEAVICIGRAPEAALSPDKPGKSEALAELPQLAALSCCACKTKAVVSGQRRRTQQMHLGSKIKGFKKTGPYKRLSWLCTFYSQGIKPIPGMVGETFWICLC